MARHRYSCPRCGQPVVASAAHHARQGTPCRACIRLANSWSCLTCGSTDPHHPTPCPALP